MFKQSVHPSTYLFGQGIAYSASDVFPVAKKSPYRMDGVPKFCGLAIAADSEVRGVRVRNPRDDAAKAIDLVEGAPVSFCGGDTLYLEPLRGYQQDGRLTLVFAETGHELAALPLHIASRSVLSFEELDPDTNTGDRFRMLTVSPALALAAKPQLQATLWIDGGSSGSGNANVRSYRLKENGDLGDYTDTAFAWPAASGEVNLSIPQSEVAVIELYSASGYGPLSGYVVVT